MSRDVELRHLRAFASVARHRSFSRAAEELLITQPALSRTIAQLEDELSVRLLDRSSRHVELTDTGAEFLVHVEQVLATLDQALAVARRRVTLRLGFSWLLPDPWTQRTVSRFEESTGATVALTRTDDPLQALQPARARHRGGPGRRRRAARGARTAPVRRAAHRRVLRTLRSDPHRPTGLDRRPALATGRQHGQRHHRPLVVVGGAAPGADRRNDELRRVAGDGGREPGHRHRPRGRAAPYPAPGAPLHPAHRRTGQPRQPGPLPRRPAEPGPPLPRSRGAGSTAGAAALTG
ncbi:LysR family transcriptional regulator [Streptomyces lasalocidi]